MEVGIKIAVATEQLGQMVVDLTVLAVDPFLQVWYEPCGPSSSILSIPTILPVPESEFPGFMLCGIPSNFLSSFMFISLK